jgi:site-specific DNA-adenine methylase
VTAPFPYFGGKSWVAPAVWEWFGKAANYVEPFCGSLAVLLGRPTPFSGTETVNDADGLVANFWRAVQADPEAVAHHADWPVIENDLHARHAWLVGRKDTLQARLEGNPDYFDAKVAGWWCWGLCCWIGHGWCSGRGPWSVEGGELVRTETGKGTRRKLPHLGDAGRGVNRQLPHLGDAGRGVNRQLLHLGNAGRGVRGWMEALADRLQNVRVACGDWFRVVGPSVTFKHGLTAVFLDPPYADEANRESDLYRMDCGKVAHDVRDWAVANGDNPLLRIALCGYEGEHDMPASWECFAWKAQGGYSSQNREGNDNPNRERIWFSPHCIRDSSMPLFDG